MRGHLSPPARLLITYFFNHVHHPLALHHLPKDDVLSVEPRRPHCGDVKLAAIVVRSTIGHCHKADIRVLDLQVFVLKIRAVDTDGTASVTSNYVTGLHHEFLNHSMEVVAFISQTVDAINADLAKVFRRPRCIVSKQSDFNATKLFAIVFHVHVDGGGDFESVHFSLKKQGITTKR